MFISEKLPPAWGDEFRIMVPPVISGNSFSATCRSVVLGGDAFQRPERGDDQDRRFCPITTHIDR
jgi:hypothetical protein